MIVNIENIPSIIIDIIYETECNLCKSNIKLSKILYNEKIINCVLSNNKIVLGHHGYKLNGERCDNHLKYILKDSIYNYNLINIDNTECLGWRKYDKLNT